MKIGIFVGISARALLCASLFQARASAADLSIPKLSEPASREDQGALWKKVKQLSFAAMAGTEGVRQVAALERNRRPNGDPHGLAIGEQLTGTNFAVKSDPAGKLEELSFELRGGCVSTRDLLAQYPGLLALIVPLDPRRHSHVGATIGGALVTFEMSPGPGPCAVGVTIQTVEVAKAHQVLR